MTHDPLSQIAFLVADLAARAGVEPPTLHFTFKTHSDAMRFEGAIRSTDLLKDNAHLLLRKQDKLVINGIPMTISDPDIRPQPLLVRHNKGDNHG